MAGPTTRASEREEGGLGMTETALTAAIMAALRTRGAWVYKAQGTAYSQAGVPDLLVGYQGRFIALEVKLPGERATPRQEWVMGRIRAAGNVAVVVHSVEEALATALRGSPL